MTTYWDWGHNDDVALFIGGPKDGKIENIRGKRTQRYPIVEPARLYSASDPTAPLYTNWRYGTYEPAVVFVDGCKYTVMADRKEHDHLDLIRRVEDEVYPPYNNGGYVWGVSTAIQQSLTFTQADIKQMVQLLVGYDPDDTRTDEEKLAWVTEGEGVDFL